MIWSTAYNLKSEHAISKDKLLATIPKLPNEWRLSFEVKPDDYSVNSYASVLHMTIGGKGGKIVGERTPAIWFHKSKGILVSTALGGKQLTANISNRCPLLENGLELRSAKF